LERECSERSFQITRAHERRFYEICSLTLRNKKAKRKGNYVFGNVSHRGLTKAVKGHSLCGMRNWLIDKEQVCLY